MQKTKILKGLILLFMIVVFSSFQCETESEYRLYVKNATTDTIIMAVTADAGYGQHYEYYSLLPNDPLLLASRGGRTSKSYSIEETIRDAYERLGRTIEVYRLTCDTCEGIIITDNYSDQYYIEKNPLVSWLPPLTSLSDNTNSFYNLNSWIIKNTGKRNKWEHATFVITKEDFSTNKR
jgi:hypothetical protein